MIPFELSIIPASILLETKSYDDLVSSTQREFPTTKKRLRASNDVQIQSMSFVHYPRKRILEVMTTTQSASSGNVNKQKIQIANVERVKDPSQGVAIQLVDGREIHIKPASLTAPVHVKCTCLDFKFRFATWNHRDDALIGAPPRPYRKKTDRPPVNPGKSPGVCKHLVRVMEELSRQDVT